MDCHDSAVGGRKDRLTEAQKAVHRLDGQDCPPVPYGGRAPFSVHGNEVDREGLPKEMCAVAWYASRWRILGQPRSCERKRQHDRWSLSVGAIGSRRAKPLPQRGEVGALLLRHTPVSPTSSHVTEGRAVSSQVSETHH